MNHGCRRGCANSSTRTSTRVSIFSRCRWRAKNEDKSDQQRPTSTRIITNESHLHSSSSSDMTNRCFFAGLVLEEVRSGFPFSFSSISEAGAGSMGGDELRGRLDALSRLRGRGRGRAGFGGASSFGGEGTLPCRGVCTVEGSSSDPLPLFSASDPEVMPPPGLPRLFFPFFLRLFLVPVALIVPLFSEVAAMSAVLSASFFSLSKNAAHSSSSASLSSIIDADLYFCTSFFFLSFFARGSSFSSNSARRGRRFRGFFFKSSDAFFPWRSIGDSRNWLMTLS